MKGPTTKTEPEWATDIAGQIEALVHPGPSDEMKRECPGMTAFALIISQSPAIKELVEAAEVGMATINSYQTTTDEEWVASYIRFQVAIKPFKDSTGGG